MSGSKRRKPPPRVIDVGKILHSKITVEHSGIQTKMHPWEASVRALAAKALGGNMRAARRFLERCLEAGLFEIPETVDDHQYRVTVPKDWDYSEFIAMYDRLGPPPWPGERDGMAKDAK